MRYIKPIFRWLSTTAQKVVGYMCKHYKIFSRLQNIAHGLRRKIRQGAAGAKGNTKGKKAKIMNKLVKGRYVCCVWERKLKPFQVKMVKISGVTGSGISRGMAQIELENGISFRGSEAKSRHLYQDKERLAGALESPTRANVLIFTSGDEARKYLREKGVYERLGESVNFTLAGKEQEV